MAVSVRMDPTLEQELASAAKLQGITKSQFIVDAVERALGRKDPYRLLVKAQGHYSMGMGNPALTLRDAGAPVQHFNSLQDKLRAKQDEAMKDWLAYQAAKKKGQSWPGGGSDAPPKAKTRARKAKP
jgi:predicted DNA-binding protein